MINIFYDMEEYRIKIMNIINIHYNTYIITHIKTKIYSIKSSVLTA